MAAISKAYQEFFEAVEQALRVPQAAVDADPNKREFNRRRMTFLQHDRMSTISAMIAAIRADKWDVGDSLLNHWADELRTAVAEPLPYEPYVSKDDAEGTHV